MLVYLAYIWNLNNKWFFHYKICKEPFPKIFLASFVGTRILKLIDLVESDPSDNEEKDQESNNEDTNENLPQENDEQSKENENNSYEIEEISKETQSDNIENEDTLDKSETYETLTSARLPSSQPTHPESLVQCVLRNSHRSPVNSAGQGACTPSRSGECRKAGRVGAGHRGRGRGKRQLGR